MRLLIPLIYSKYLLGENIIRDQKQTALVVGSGQREVKFWMQSKFKTSTVY